MAKDNISKFYQAFNEKYDNFSSEDDFRSFLNNATDENFDNLYSAFNDKYDNFSDVAAMRVYLGYPSGGSVNAPKQTQHGDDVNYDGHTYVAKDAGVKQYNIDPAKMNAAKTAKPMPGISDFQKQMDARLSTTKMQHNANAAKAERARNVAMNTLGGRKDDAVVFNQGTQKFEQGKVTTAGDVVSNVYEQQSENRKESYRMHPENIAGDVFATIDDGSSYAQAWANAEERTAADVDAAAIEASKNIGTFITGVPGATSAASLASKSMVSNLAYHDLDRMAEDAWNGMGLQKRSAIVNEMYDRLSTIYPGASSSELMDAARQMARQMSDQRMFEYAVKMNAPKDALDNFGRRIVEGNSIYKILMGTARVQAGTTGDMEAREAAMQQYKDEGHGLSSYSGDVLGFVLDPTMLVGGYAGGFATRMLARPLTSISGRLLAGKAASSLVSKTGTVIAEAAPRLGGSVARGIGSGVNFATFEGLGDAVSQYQWGGVIDGVDEDGRYIINEGSVGHALGTAGHGFLMGLAVSPVAPLVGNVGSKVMNMTRSTAGKMLVYTGELGVGVGLEGTIFASPQLIDTYKQYGDMMAQMADPSSEYYIEDEDERAEKIKALEDERDEQMYDVWDENMKMMASFKVHGMMKTARQTLTTLAGKPGAKEGFETRLRSLLNGHKSMLLTDEEKEEIIGKYGDINNVIEECRTNIKAAKTGEKIDFGRIAELVEDESISADARAKVYYYATGRMLPEPTILDCSMTETRDTRGNVVGYTVITRGAVGVITKKNYTSRRNAETALAELNRQKELNLASLGERRYNAEGEKRMLYDACKAVAERNGMSEDLLYEMAQRDPRGLNEFEQKMLQEIATECAGMKADDYGAMALAEEMKGRTGEDVAKALKKEPSRRTDAERAAVEGYISELFAQPISDRTAPNAEEYKKDPSYQRGYSANVNEARDIYTEMIMSDDKASEEYHELEKAWQGVQDRLRDESDAKVAERNDNMDKIRHDDETTKEAFLKEKDDNGNNKVVYVTKGNIELREDGSIDTTASDDAVTVFNPETGKVEMMSPKDLAGMGKITSVVEQFGQFDAEAEEMVRMSENKITGMVSTEAGSQVMLPDGRMGVVTGNRGEEIDVMMEDGSQATTTEAELRSVSDAMLVSDYMNRHANDAVNDVQEVPAHAPVMSGDELGVIEGRVEGAPKDYEGGMRLIVRRDDGKYDAVVCMGRFKGDIAIGKDKPEYTPDENGQFVGYKEKGKEKPTFKSLDEMNKMVTAWVDESATGEVRSVEPAADAAGTVAESHVLTEENRRKVEAIGEALGVKVVYDENVDANGYYDHNTKTLAINPDKINGVSAKVGTVFGHEVTHAIKDASADTPELWNNFVAIIRKAVGEEQFDARVEQFIKDYEKYKNLPEEKLIEEVCAQYAGEKFVKGNIEGFKAVVDDAVEKSKAGEIKKIIEDIISKFNKLLERFKSEGASADEIVTLEDARKAWEGMLQYAIDKEAQHKAKMEEAERAAVEKPTAEVEYENAVSRYGEKSGRKIKATFDDRAADLDKKKKALDKAQNDFDDAPIGKEEKAEKALAKAQQEYDESKADYDHWAEVKSLSDAAAREERARIDAIDAQRHAEAVEAEQQRQAEELAKRAEQEERGANAVHPAIREKWEGSQKVDGMENEIVLPNGERVEGRYMLVESGAATPSHDARNGFAKSEGFPVDENGNTVNDRDYERDADAQRVTRDMASKYDGRALQSVPVVSKDGVVLSGNGRTMAGDIAAAEGTDAGYIETLKKYPQQFGFTREQVEGMEHPRVVFVAKEDMPYTAETFAKFNQQDMKSQSRTEQSVKMGKLVDDNAFGRIVRRINGFDTLGEFYNDEKACAEALQELYKAGAINDMQLAEMRDGDKLSAVGRQMLENMLVGKAFDGNPDAIRMLSEYPSMRQRVITALGEIANNKKLGEDYSLEKELAESISLAYQARKSGVKDGEAVSGYALQTNIFTFDDGETVADYENATMLMLADLLNGRETNKLKNTMALYNDAAKDAAAGQIDMFSGAVRSKEEILKDVLNTLNYGNRKDIESRLNEAAEQRKQGAAGEEETGGVQQDDAAQDGDRAGRYSGNAEERTEGEGEIGYSNKKETVAKTEPKQPNNVISDDSSLSSGTETDIAPNKPNGESTVSGGKDTKNFETDQKNVEEAAEVGGAITGVVEDDGRGVKAVKALEEAYRSGDKAEIKKAVDEIKNLYEQGVNIKFDDEDVDADELEDYEGSDPKMLAEQYAVRLARHLFSDDDADLGYIESGIKSDVANKQKADGTAKEVNEAQRMMTEALVEHLSSFGVPISADVEEGQKMIDEVNGRGIVLSKGKKRALETASLAENEQDQPTVVSSADGAKIQKNLESLKKDYGNVSNYPKQFIGEIAKALGAVKHGSNSQYATFETVNGKIVTIRLADHNAKVSTFDNHDESEGISIVITPKANNGVTNDGKAHVVEFFYDAIKLRRAEGKPLVDIISSIEQALYSGEFKDKTGLAERTEVNAEDIKMMKAWHGSAAVFDAFDSSHFLEGEGSMVYGAGHYVTDVEGTGRMYANIARANNRKVGRTPMEHAVDSIMGVYVHSSRSYSFEDAKEAAKRSAKKEKKSLM